MKDPVIEELWKTKDEIAKECNNDVAKLSALIKDREKTQEKLVDLSKMKKTEN